MDDEEHRDILAPVILLAHEHDPVGVPFTPGEKKSCSTWSCVRG